MYSRKSNVELLRVLCTFGVVILHLYGFEGGVKDRIACGSFNVDVFFVILFEVLFSIAVNVFVIIFAYFNYEKNDPVSKKIKKTIFLLLTVSLYRVVFYFASIVIGIDTFSFTTLIIKCIPSNWYIVCYIGLYFISGYLDKIISGMDKRKICILIAIFTFVISVEPFFVDCIGAISGKEVLGVSFVGAYGDQSGYTLINFILLYLIGCAVRRIIASINMKRILIGYLISLVVLCVCYYFFGIFEQSSVVICYSNPILIVNAVCLFSMFVKLNIPNNPLISILSKASLTVYLIHPFFVELVLKYSDLIFEPLSKYSFLMAEMIIGTLIYLIGIILYYIITKQLSFVIDYFYTRRVQR